MDREHYDFTNKMFGFTATQNCDPVLVALEEAGISRDKIDCLDYDDRQTLVDNLEHSKNPITWLKIHADKVIGSGPAEFVRDLKQAPVGETLVCVDIDSDMDKQHVMSVLRRCNVHHVKYFHPMYTEHVTVEPGHRQEIQPVK